MGWTVANRYEIDVATRYAGWFGQVYAAHDTVLERRVAVKAMEAVEDARREALIMAAYGTHTVLPQIHDFVVEGSRAYIVMELLSGACLGDYFLAERRREIGLATAMTVAILQGLGHLHARGILHRDIHPANLVVCDDRPETVRIVDYGLAARKGDEGLWRGAFWSDAVEYMPPEQFADDVVLDDSSDLYTAAGVCVYLLTGEAPCLPWGRWIDPGDDPARSAAYRQECYRRHLEGLPVNVDEPSLRAVLARALHPVRGERYRSAQELIEALEPFR